ncbi:MAG TPA: VTT domain-containing protein [Bacillus bacterium]|nr:VTT domain-containing protein [Bacillus sp. (in: firmicutes)]
MDFLIKLLPDHTLIAAIVSIIINITISVAGFIPSTFITAANIFYFGFQFGLFLSIAGEAIGAIISFILYRKGVRALENKLNKQPSNRFIEKLKNAQGLEAIILVLTLRIFPFVPSGLVTLAASISRMKTTQFAIASTVGKIPALLIEAYSVQSFLSWKTQYQIGITAIALCIIIFYYFCRFMKK